jgi:hypothetical protein
MGECAPTPEVRSTDSSTDSASTDSRLAQEEADIVDFLGNQDPAAMAGLGKVRGSV